MADDLVQRLRGAARKANVGVGLDILAAIDEIERLRAEVERYKVAWTEYNDRTEWVQQTAKPKELGMHRADILRQRIENAERELAELRERFEKAPSVDGAGMTYIEQDKVLDQLYQLSREGHRVRLVRED